MKKIIGIVALVPVLLALQGCGTQKRNLPIVPPKEEQVVQAPKKVSFSPSLLMKKNAEGVSVLKTVKELSKTIENRLLPAEYLPCAEHLMLKPGITIKDKVDVLHGMQKSAPDEYTQDVISFFARVLQENELYLTAHPLTDLDSSLISRSPDSFDFLKDHPEISNVIWSLEELYKQGNTLLQEAVRLNNSAAVRYLLALGASARHLNDPRGPVLALEWADKYGYTEIAQLLAKDLNRVQETKTTVLDDLLYQDPQAARLVKKYGGKTVIELT